MFQFFLQLINLEVLDIIVKKKSNSSKFNFEIDPYLSDHTDKDYLINREKAVKEFKKNIKVVI